MSSAASASNAKNPLGEEALVLDASWIVLWALDSSSVFNLLLGEESKSLHSFGRLMSEESVLGMDSGVAIFAEGLITGKGREIENERVKIVYTDDETKSPKLQS